MKFQTLIAIIALAGVTAVNLEKSQLSVHNSDLIQVEGMNHLDANFDIAKAIEWVTKKFPVMKKMLKSY